MWLAFGKWALDLTNFVRSDHHRTLKLNSNPLHVVEAHILGTAMVEPRGARVGMVCHLARLLQRAAILEIRGDAGSSEGVIADRRGDAPDLRPAAHYGVRFAGCDGAAGEPLLAPAAGQRQPVAGA